MNRFDAGIQYGHHLTRTGRAAGPGVIRADHRDGGYQRWLQQLILFDGDNLIHLQQLFKSRVIDFQSQEGEDPEFACGCSAVGRQPA